MTTLPNPSAKRLFAPAFWLGFALSGFFDGILLHQVLQWHHLLSIFRPDDVRFQILADGYFHLFMYVIAGIALVYLWRARDAFEAENVSRRFAAWLLIGFGVWHFVDAIASHWVLGIHRIKMDSPNPLFWDLGWLGLFGAIPFLIGLWLRREPHSPKAHKSGSLAVIFLGLLTAGAAFWASAPPPGQQFTTVVFSPAVPPMQGFATAASLSDAVVWSDDNGVFIVVAKDESNFLDWYSNGALFVSGSGLPAGCFSWASGVPTAI